MEQNLLAAILLTAFAGLSTGVGSAIAFFSRKTNKSFLAVALGFSAGVMIFVSFVEIYFKGQRALVEVYGDVPGKWMTMAAFFAGIFIILIIDKLIPSYENPHEPVLIENAERPTNDMKLHRMGLFTALAIAIHNFPEGLATFTAALTDPALGASIAVAIAIHNIPEGIAVSVPIYYATGSRKKAFWLSALSGLAEPVGAAIGYFVFMKYFTPSTYGFMFAGVAGIMVFISLDELLPTAREYGSGHNAIYGMIAGMMVMAFSLGLFF